MPEAASGEVVIRHFNHIFRLDRLPFGRPFGGPSARSAWGISRKAYILPYRLELIGEGRLFVGFNARRNPT
jgi:hypothetical protein